MSDLRKLNIKRAILFYFILCWLATSQFAYISRPYKSVGIRQDFAIRRRTLRERSLCFGRNEGKVRQSFVG